MEGCKQTTINFRNAYPRQALFLTFILLFLTIPRPCCANSLPPDAHAALQTQLAEIRAYIRDQGKQKLGLLPGEARDAIGWLSGQWHSLSSISLPGEESTSDALALAQGQSEEMGWPAHLTASFHHKGFLPMHDAMVLGMGFTHDAVGRKLHFTLRPFWGQSWHSFRHYWGSELALDIAQRPDGLPWGKVTIGYTSGDNSLTDHGSGVELRGNVDLTHNVEFTSGIRHNGITGDSNYVMLSWKMSFDNP
ncbi:MAG: hypothetical protein KGI97_03720 [Alphaproteobacteria bacterium]|nr:hypothetical protein [Alphaproteobacteria bacterium]